MYNFSVVRILKSLSKEEIKEFNKFAKSPFFGGSEYVYNFFKVIKKYHPEFDSKGMEKTRIFKKLYPGKKYDDTVLRKLSSELLRLVDKFIVFKGSEYYPSLEGKFYLTYIRNKKLSHLFDKKWSEVQQGFDKAHVLNYDNLFFRHLYQIEAINHNNETNRNQYNGEQYLNFGKYILNYALIVTTHALTNNDIIKDAYNSHIENNLLTHFLDNFNFENYLKALKESKSPEYAPVQLNYMLMMMYKDQMNDKHYENYKKAFYDNIEGLNEFLRYNLFCFLINNAYHKVQLGKAEYSKELISVLDKMTAENAIVDPYKKFIGNNHIRIAAISAIALGRFDWIESFLFDNLHRIDPEYKNNLLSYVNALTAFSKGEYERSLELLTGVEFNLIPFMFDVKEMLLKIYYELDYIDTASSALDAFKSFIAKNKYSSEIRKTNLSSFIKFYGKLLRIKAKGDNYKLSGLRKEIDEQYFTSKSWVLEKIKRIEVAA